MNHTLHRFICRLVSELKKESRDRWLHMEDMEDNIPFIISTLYQSFSNNEEKYKEFIFDLEEWDDFFITVKKSNDEYGIVSASIDSWDDEYHYELNFFNEERNYGYCECTPDMPDYREDKECCGHGCDADFCSFTLNKVINIVSDTWQGDQHDYWEFEDSFYKVEQELLEEKERKRKESRIKELKNRIEADTKKLMELEKEYYESRVN